MIDFHPKLFWNRPPEGFYDADIGMTDPDMAGQKIMAIGDVNSDGYMDLITMNDQEDSFVVHYYNSSSKEYISGQTTAVDTTTPNAKISNIVVSRNMQVLQQLYIIYYPDKDLTDTQIKAFK